MLKDGDSIEYYEDNTRINYSCLMNKKTCARLIPLIIVHRKNMNYSVTRSAESYYRELKAHNRLFKLHLFRKHTTDCDLEENIKWWKDLIYHIIGW